MAVVVTLSLIAASLLWLATRSQSLSLAQERSMEVDSARELLHAALAHAEEITANGTCLNSETISSAVLGEHSYDLSIVSAHDRQVLTVGTAQDTYIEEKSPDKTNADHGDLHVESKVGANQHALLSFDVSAIGSDRTVQSATLWLYIHTEEDEAPIRVHENTIGFDEATATWSSHGASLNPVAMTEFPPTASNDHWISVPITATVQRWVNNPSENSGIRLLATSDNLVSKVTSKEHATSANRPYLEIVHSDRVAPNATIAIQTGIASGRGNTSVATTLPLLQAEQTKTLRPGGEGVDAWFDASNNGDDNELLVSASPARMAALRFELETIPLNAVVSQATLSLYTVDVTTPGTVLAQAFTAPWSEGQITQDQARTLDPWARTYGEVSQAFSHSSDSVLKNQTLDIDLTETVQRWVSGEPNFGLRLSTDNADLTFASSDHANKNRRWRLIVSYACPCGMACVASTIVPDTSAGELLYIVDSVLALTDEELIRQALFKAWGYTVTVASDTTFELLPGTYLAGKDVVYVSADARSDSVGDLGDASVGVVSEHPDAMDEIRIAASTSGKSADGINVESTAHSMTAALPLSSVTLSDTGIALLAMESPASGAQTLATVGGQPALLALPAGQTDSTGNPAASNRVALPFGANTRWRNLNSNAQLLVRSALKWAADGEVIDTFCNADFAPNAVADELNPATPGMDDVAWVPEGATLNGSSAPSGGAWLVTDRDNGRLKLIASDGTLIDQVNTPTFDPAGASYVADGKHAGNWVYVEWWAERLVFMSPDGESIAQYDTALANMITTTGVTYIGTTPEGTFDSHVAVVDQWEGVVTIYDQNGVVQKTLNIPASEEPTGIVHLPGSDKLLLTYPSSRRIIDTDGTLIREYSAGQPGSASGIAIHGETCQHVLADSGSGLIKFLELLPEPEARWEFDEGSGATTVDSIGGRVGAVTDATWATMGVAGTALSFGTSSSVVAVPADASLALARDFSLSAWVYPGSVSILQGVLSNDSYYRLALKDDELLLTQQGTLEQTVVSSGASIKADAWTYLVATVDSGGAVVLYANGENVGSGNFTEPAADSTSELLIGRDHDDNEFHGTIDDVRIYSEVINAATVGKNYANTSPPAGINPFCSVASDDFQSGDWTGSTGPMAWGGDWQEVNESGSPYTGDEVVGQPGNSLFARIRDNDGGGEGIERAIDLSDYTTATLTFNSWRAALESDDYVMVLYSSDGGSNWTEIQRIQGPGTDSLNGAGVRSSLTLPSPLTNNSMIRFLTWSGMGGSDRVYFDNVSITACP